MGCEVCCGVECCVVQYEQAQTTAKNLLEATRNAAANSWIQARSCWPG